MEPAIHAHQESSRAEAAEHGEVAWAHGPDGKDWHKYFCGTFVLEKQFEHWKGGRSKGNVAAAPTKVSKRDDYIPVWSLRKTSVGLFDEAVRATSARSGIVAVFRTGPADAEPFGVWLAWVRVGDHVLLVDLQNSCVSGSLTEAVGRLAWTEPARNDEVFYAPRRVSSPPERCVEGSLAVSPGRAGMMR